MDTFVQPDSRLNGHPVRTKVPGVEAGTGPLGHGLPIAVGDALAAKIDGSPRRVLVLTGDGELQEGSNWEALMAAAQFELDNLIVVADRNHLQQGATTEDANDLSPWTAKSGPSAPTSSTSTPTTTRRSSTPSGLRRSSPAGRGRSTAPSHPQGAHFPPVSRATATVHNTASPAKVLEDTTIRSLGKAILRYGRQGPAADDRERIVTVHRTVSRKTFLLAPALAALGLSAAACGRADSGSSGPSGGETITVKHAFGSTEVPVGVTRIASVSWANQDVPLAMDILPVGFAKQTWGVDDGSGMLAWTKKKVDELVAAGGAQPALFDETDSIDFAAVSDTAPEVILAACSGLTQKDYDTLSKIAPTIAYPTVAWGTPWRDMITMDATAIGKADEAAALIADLEKQVADAVAPHPEIAGKKAAFFYAVPSDMSTFGYYTTLDPRTAFMEDLGMTIPDSVAKASQADPDNFYLEFASENADQVSDVELMVMYGEASELAGIQAHPLLGTIPAIKNGAVAFVGNGTPLSAATNPGPLSIPWGIKDYVDLIAAAAGKVQ